MPFFVYLSHRPRSHTWLYLVRGAAHLRPPRLSPSITAVLFNRGVFAMSPIGWDLVITYIPPLPEDDQKRSPTYPNAYHWSKKSPNPTESSAMVGQQHPKIVPVVEARRDLFFSRHKDFQNSNIPKFQNSKIQKISKFQNVKLTPRVVLSGSPRFLHVHSEQTTPTEREAAINRRYGGGWCGDLMTAR